MLRLGRSTVAVQIDLSEFILDLLFKFCLEQNVDVLRELVRHIESLEDFFDMIHQTSDLKHHLFRVELFFEHSKHRLEPVTLSYHP